MDLLEKDLTGLTCCARGQHGVTRRHLRAPHELGKMVNIREPQAIWNIFGIGCGLAHRGSILRPQPVGDTHFIKIGVTDKRKQTAVLVLPTEAAHACLTGSLQDRNLNSLTVNSSFTNFWLVFGNGLQSTVVNRFDKAVPKSVECRPQRSDVLRNRHVFLRLWNDRAIVDYGTPADAIRTVVN